MLQIVIIMGRLHPIGVVVRREVVSVDGLVARRRMTEHGDLLGREGGVADAFYLVVEFSMDAGACHADECPVGQVDALRPLCKC